MSQPRSHGLSLNHRFWASIVVAMACSLVLGIGLITRYGQQLETSLDNHARLAAFRLTLDAANRISAERGPTNRVLGEEAAADTPSRRLLRDFRAATDAALAEAAATPTLAEGVPALRRVLERARQRADTLSGKPLAERSTDEVTGTIEAMFGVYDAAQPLIELGMADLLRAKTDLVGRALVMRMLGELRDYAGRLGSHLIIPMVRGEPMEPARRSAYDQTQGQVRELWHLAAQMTGTSADPRVASAHLAVLGRFLGEGAALLQATLDASVTGEYGTNPTLFTASIVPTFAPLEQLRDAYIDATMAELRADAAAARRSLIIVAVATLLALLFELALLLAAQKLLFRPLLLASSRIVQLAEGELDPPDEPPQARGEILTLYRSLAILRTRLTERATLTETLRRQAETDEVTGALNRRALNAEVARLTGAEAGSRRIGLILVDIDHFNSVSDAYGHAAGDEVLAEVARRLRTALRRDHVLARFGDGEFAILLANRGGEAPEVAERLRRALLEPPIQIAWGGGLPVTATLGAAVASLRPDIWPELVDTAGRALHQARELGRNQVVTLDVA